MIEAKKYFLFSGEMYYAEGGMSDFIAYHESLELLIQCGEHMLTDQGCRWYHILDVSTMSIVKVSGEQIYGTIVEGDL